MSAEQTSMNQLITDNIDVWTSTVKTKSASGRGSSKKRELYGVKKLRELILELAVRGKLVPQDSNDEPASVLLERIAEEQLQLVKEKKIKKPKKLTEITPEEKLFDLPEGWAWERLGNIGDTNIGLTYSPKDVGDTGTPVLRSANIQKNRIDLKDLIRVNTEVKNSAYVGRGDLLICARNGSKALVGKTAKIGELNEPMAFGAFMAIFRSQINSYVEVFLNSPVYRRNLEGVSTTTINQITQSNLRATLCAVPPFSEQHRIVAKVDELMTLCDQLEQQTETSIEAHQVLVTTLLDTLTNSADADELMQNWARISEHFDTLFTTEASIDQLKQTILQLAVMGKLVPQDPNDEPAAKLLERIAEEKAQLIKDKKIKKQKALPPIADDEKPFELPNGWEWCRLPDLGELARGKSKHRPRNDPKLYEGGSIPLVQTGDVARANGTIQTYTAKYNEFGLAQSQLWPKGTLCITIAANIADTATLGFDACFPDSVVGYTPYDKEIPTVYFDYFIKTAKENLERFAPSTAQKNINLEILSNVLVPCPPKLQFSRIIEKVDVLLGICDDLKARLKESQATQLHLTNAIVEQAV
ncbi:restriction endonuclease subunit S [Vibrio splendidus]